MELIPPPGLPSHAPDTPAGPAVVPMLPTRRRPPGRRAPLPDLIAVRRIQVPDSLPPYDADPGRCSAGTGAPGTSADQLDASQPDQPDTSPDQPDTSPDQPGDGPDDPGDGPDTGPRRTLRAEPGPGGWPSQFAQVLAETLAGSRPAQQLTPWTTEQTRQRIRELRPMLATGQRPRVRKIMTSAPAMNVLEMTAVIGFGSRVRVLALRLERPDEARWQCTAIESA